MSHLSSGVPADRRSIQKQVRLPMSKAMEIAYKNIRLRLGRSLLVTSAIILALAFFVSIQTTETVVEGMRGWIVAFPQSGEAQALAAERDTLRARTADAAAQLRAVDLETQADGDIEAAFGLPYEQLREQFGRLPVPRTQLEKIAAHPESAAVFGGWQDDTRRLDAVVSRLAAPGQLQSRLADSGVATTPEAIENNRIQTRWLMGLALLVAFVGILNAMLMSVTERFREIGTMKCLGALDGFIIKLFLLESLFQGVVGTVLGLAVGLGLSLLLGAVTYGRLAFINLDWTTLAILSGVTLVVGVGLTVGGALLPAWQAAKMQPIEAMRTDV